MANTLSTGELSKYWDAANKLRKNFDAAQAIDTVFRQAETLAEELLGA